jgi:hypothetical protein
MGGGSSACERAGGRLQLWLRSLDPDGPLSALGRYVAATIVSADGP